MAPGYRAPDRATIYVDSVTQRCENLIGSGIWSGLEVRQLRAWLTNFSTAEELYFAIRILDHLIYRSDSQTAALINQLFQRCLPERLAQLNLGPQITTDIIGALQGPDQPHVRLVPVVDEYDSPTKSGPTVSRLIKRTLNLRDDWFIFPDKIDSDHHREARIIIFVDDFLGTGFQFTKFFRHLSARFSLAGKTLIYAPLIAHIRGINKLQRSLRDINIVFAERIDDTHNLFQTANSDGLNTTAEMERFYDNFLKKKRLNLVPKRQLGYGKLGLCLAFEHATPNSSLPLLWLNRQGFIPLFKR